MYTNKPSSCFSTCLSLFGTVCTKRARNGPNNSPEAELMSHDILSKVGFKMFV